MAYRKFHYEYNGEYCTSVLYTSKNDKAAWRHLVSDQGFIGRFRPMYIS